MTEAIVLVSLVIAGVGLKLVAHTGLISIASYFMYRWTRPRLAAPLAAYLNELDRMLAIPADVAEAQLAILRKLHAHPEVIAAAEKTVRQVRRAHEAYCEHRSRWHCPSHGDVRCVSCGKVFGSVCGRCGFVKVEAMR